MNNDDNLFLSFEMKGNKILEVLHKKALGNNSNKILRKWNLVEVSSLVGRTSHTLLKNIKKGLLKKPESNGTNQRIYTMEDINQARILFKTKPEKPKDQKASIIAFTNFKGGVAKTTSAIHSAHYFAKAGYKVLFIDSDSQASGTSAFGYAPDHHFGEEETLLPVFQRKITNVRDIIKKTYWDGLDLIPANLSLYNVELIVPVIQQKAKENNEKFQFYSILSTALKDVENDYDIIIIDCPPSMSILNTNALYAASGLIIPCPPELPDVASMFQFFSMIHGTLKRIPSKNYAFVKILMTKHDGGSMSNLVTQALRKVYGTYIMHSEMHITQVIKRARAEMRSVYELETYNGSKKTLERALAIVDSVNREIEQLVKQSWAPAELGNELLMEEI